MKKGITLFLKGAVILVSLPVLALCIYGIVVFIMEGPFNPKYATILYPLFTACYIGATLFFMALYQTFKLLTLIDQSLAFSELAVHALKKIKRHAYAFSVVFILVMPAFYAIAELDDAPGVLVINLILVFASLVIGLFVNILQALLKEAIDIKEENALTV